MRGKEREIMSKVVRESVVNCQKEIERKTKRHENGNICANINIIARMKLTIQEKNGWNLIRFERREERERRAEKESSDEKRQSYENE